MSDGEVGTTGLPDHQQRHVSGGHASARDRPRPVLPGRDDERQRPDERRRSLSRRVFLPNGVLAPGQSIDVALRFRRRSTITAGKLTLMLLSGQGNP